MLSLDKSLLGGWHSFFFYHLREQFINRIAIFVLYTTGPQRIANPQTGMPTHCRLLFISSLCPHPRISSGFTNNLAVSIYTPGCREALYKQSVLPKSTTPIPRPLNSEFSALALIAICRNEVISSYNIKFCYFSCMF